MYGRFTLREVPDRTSSQTPLPSRAEVYPVGGKRREVLQTPSEDSKTRAGVPTVTGIGSTPVGRAGDEVQRQARRTRHSDSAGLASGADRRPGCGGDDEAQGAEAMF